LPSRVDLAYCSFEHRVISNHAEPSSKPAFSLYGKTQNEVDRQFQSNSCAIISQPQPASGLSHSRPRQRRLEGRCWLITIHPRKGFEYLYGKLWDPGRKPQATFLCFRCTVGYVFCMFLLVMGRTCQAVSPSRHPLPDKPGTLRSIQDSLHSSFLVRNADLYVTIEFRRQYRTRSAPAARFIFPVAPL
jgi:hypothetical protein